MRAAPKIPPLSPLPEFLLEVEATGAARASLEGARAYLQASRDEIRHQVSQGKGYWFRGFPVRTLEQFHQLIEIVDPGLLPYSGAKVRNAEDPAVRLYSPTSTPRYRKNFLHNEMAYQRDVPSSLTVYCQRPAPHGGESLVGDQRAVYRSLDPALRQRLEERRLRFVRFLRNRTRLQTFLTRHFDLFALMPSWQSNLGTDDRDEAQQLCEARGFECQWTPEGGLSIAYVMDPCRPHPVTGEPMWVNNAHLFQLNRRVYGAAMTALLRAYFRATGSPPTTCTYGDGAPIEDAVVRDILQATERNEVDLPLGAGDFLYLNNHSIGHGRRVFRGPRKLYFGVFA